MCSRNVVCGDTDGAVIFLQITNPCSTEPCLRYCQSRPPVRICQYTYKDIIKIDSVGRPFIFIRGRGSLHWPSTWRGCCEELQRHRHGLITDKLHREGGEGTDCLSQTQDTHRWGKTYLSETQTMLPLTIGGVCVFLCLAASSSTLIVSFFPIILSCAKVK